MKKALVLILAAVAVWVYHLLYWEQERIRMGRVR